MQSPLFDQVPLGRLRTIYGINEMLSEWGDSQRR